jgi:glycosyltransferase involved in cell wall biosynthesis
MPKTTDDINMNAMAGASNKAFDYLASGLALVVSDLPAWRTLYVEPGYGIACDPDDPTSIARALWSLVDDPTEVRAMGERGRRRIDEEWNYETEFAKVFECLNGERKLASTSKPTRFVGPCSQTHGDQIQ